MAQLETRPSSQDSDRVPEPGQQVTVRGHPWVVKGVERSTLEPPSTRPDDYQRNHLVTLVSLDDDRWEHEIEVFWELEPGRRVHERSNLPVPDPENLDDPEVLGAFLDAVRWGAVTNADKDALQAPFRSGITIEDYQLEPLVRALRMPRANLLIADDVGLGKTIEAGLVIQELILRHRARTCLTPNSLEARRLAQDDETEEGEPLSLAGCARRLIEAGSELVLITGSHENTVQVINTLYGSHGVLRSDKWERLPGSYHGSGCTLASAIAANLAHGMDIIEAVRGAQEYTWRTLAAGFRPGMGQYLPDRFFWTRGNDTDDED